MRPVFLSVLAFAACTLADYNTVVADIKNLGVSLSQLKNDTQQVIPGVAVFPFALKVEVDAVKLDNIILQAIEDSNASPPFGDDGSLQVSSAILKLNPAIQSSLETIASKVSTFGDLGLIVLSSLYQLKNDTDTFGKAVTAKLSPAYAAVAPQIISQIDEYFNSAITAYGGKTS